MSEAIIGRIDEMGGRIDELEASIGELMAQAGVEEEGNAEGYSRAHGFDTVPTLLEPSDKTELGCIPRSTGRGGGYSVEKEEPPWSRRSSWNTAASMRTTSRFSGTTTPFLITWARENWLRSTDQLLDGRLSSTTAKRDLLQL